MRKVYIFLIIAALCVLGVSAKTIHIWRNGVKTDLPIQTNDSITFSEENAPTILIWHKDSTIYQLSLAVDDSITYSPDSVTPGAICFDYDHWRELDTINIYEFNGHQWQTIALPWADEATTTIPDYYRFPNLESHIDSIANDTVPTWQLAFNTCHNTLLDGVHMFGLWNEKSNIMRIYSYLEELPNPNAAYCFYRVESSAPVFVDPDAKTWMPSDSIIKKGNWNAAALSGVASAPSTTICDLMPFASLKQDGTEAFAPVSPGWVAFDLPLCTGTFSVPEGGSIKFTLEAVQNITATGTVDLNLALQGTASGSSTGIGTSTSKGGITIPGNKNKKTAGWLTAWGSFASGIGSAITSGVSASGQSPEAGAAGAIIQGLGSCLSLAGNCMNANEEAKDKKYGLDFSTNDTINTSYEFNLNFDGTIAGQFDAQLTSTLASTAKPLTISYAKFFEGILAHPKPNQAPKMPKDSGDVNGLNLALGIWNLKHQPIYYVYNKYDPIAPHPDGKSLIVSFLDPSSIELELNMDNPFFDANEIDSITLIAYDFAFVDNNYNLPAQSYYDFYGIPHSVNLSEAPYCYYLIGASAFLLDGSGQSKSHTFIKGDKAFTGVPSDSLAAHGFGMYNMVYSPAVYINAQGGNQVLNLTEISVAVVVEMTFKNGEKRLFAERYLPEIKVYGDDDLTWDPMVHYRFTNIPDHAPDSINGIPLTCPLYDKLKHKIDQVVQHNN